MKKTLISLSILPFFAFADGFSLVESLNENYNSLGDKCTPESPVLCSGVILRSAENNSPTWVPSTTQQKNKTMAASFIRKDIGPNKIWAHQYIGYGIIYGNPVDQGSFLTPEGLCIFPTNGGSDLRDNRGCGKKNSNIDKNENLSGCLEMGINTADEWLNLSDSEQCSFNVHDSKQANQAIVAQIKYNDTTHSTMWNEILIDTSSWDPALAKKPISALFYHKGYVVGQDTPFTERGGLEGAQYEQVKFYEETGMFIPIVSISNIYNKVDVFSYSPDEQVIQDEQ